MRSIPSALLEKIKHALQTVGNDANPQMEIIAQKANKYLSQGNLLQPRTVRTGNVLGQLDICIRREDANLDPTEIVMAYIEDNLAKVATLPYNHTPDQKFEYKYTIGPATDVACEFNGSWKKIEDRDGIYFDKETVWALVTDGEPFIVTLQQGALYCQNGSDSSTKIALASSDVVKCSMIRGWKNIQKADDDQGIIVAFIKTDGRLYYTNYAIQTDGTTIWEVAREITGSWSKVSNVSVFRTNDYRTGFALEADNNIYILLTTRNWAGMAIPSEIVKAGKAAGLNKLTMTHITYRELSPMTERVVGRISGFVIGIGTGNETAGTATKAEIVTDSLLKITFSNKLAGFISEYKQNLVVSNETGTVIYKILLTYLGNLDNELMIDIDGIMDTLNNVKITYNGLNKIFVMSTKSMITKVNAFDIVANGLMPIPTNTEIVSGSKSGGISRLIMTSITYVDLSESTITEIVKAGKISGLNQMIITKVGTSDV